MTRARKPKETPAIPLSAEQEAQARDMLATFIKAGRWPLMLIGENADGTLSIASAPPSANVMRGMVRTAAELICPEMFE